MIKILEYTDRLDYLVIAHTQSLKDTAGKVDFSGEDDGVKKVEIKYRDFGNNITQPEVKWNPIKRPKV